MKKIWIITFCFFLFLSFCTIPMIQKKNTLRTNVTLEDVTGFTNQTIYLMDLNHYMVEVDVFLNPTDSGYPIESIFTYLKEDNKNMNASFRGYIPSDVVLLNYEVVDSILFLDFNEKFLDMKDSNKIAGLVHSFLNIKDILKVSIQVNEKNIDDYPEYFDKNFPINKTNQFYNRKDISKVVIYYIDHFDQDYYLPVTKYINDGREKIEVIIDELKNDIPDTLISYLSETTNLINYDFEKDVLILNFDSSIQNDKKEEIYHMIASSVFCNYDVNSVVFQVNSKIDEILSNS